MKLFAHAGIGVITLGATLLTPAMAHPAAASSAPTVIFTRCPGGTPARTECGTVSVPLDRADPKSPVIGIAFQFYPATDTSKPAVSTIVPSNGGPGASNIAAAGMWLSLLGPLRSRWNLLAIDHRGIGASAAIDCPGLQHVQGNQTAAARECGAKLGKSAYRYGSGDVADDVDAVRRALHLNEIDYYGVSYGAVDVRAYAYRYPAHLRAAILDSPYNSQDPAFLRTLPTAMRRISAHVCERSPSCSSVNHHPYATFDALVHRLQRQPVRGIGYDADGHPHSLVVDEHALLGVLYNDYFSDPAFLNQGEIFAAARALQAGDATALLRLVAESPAPTDFGPADGFVSVGADYAVFCADSRMPWNKHAPEARREAQYQRALAALPADAMTPFTPPGWAGFIASQPVLLVPGANACVPWPRPVRPEPPFPNYQPFPSRVPALLLGGGLDYLDINTERTLIPLFPSGKFVTVANAGHVTTFWNPCAQAIALHFLTTLRTGDTRCASDTTGAMHNPFTNATGKLQLQGLASFPASVRDAQPAHPTRPPSGTRLDLRIANVAWLTASDAVYRLPRMTGVTGRGLRGGSYTVSRDKHGTRITYHRAKFVNDEYVSGQATLTTANRFYGTLSIVAPDGGVGTLHIDAILWDPAHPRASITGVIGGTPIAAFTQTR
jgi:pimeloyl-ACP methyl ester carboxylesterase